MSFPISLSSGFGELAPRDCSGQGWEKSAHGACIRLGKWISICFLGPKNKRKINKKPGQMAALVKAEDTGDRDRHEGPCGRSWSCSEPLAPAGSISAHRSLRASPGGGRGDETGLAWLSALLPKPLLQNTSSKRAGAGGNWRRVGLALQGLAYLCRAAPGPAAASTAREPAEPLRARPPVGPSRPLPPLLPCRPSPCPLLPQRPASAAGTGSSSGILGQQTLPAGEERKAKHGRGRGRGYGLGGGTRGSAGPSSRHCRPGERAALWQAASLQLCTVCPFPSWERQRGLSQIPPPCPVPRRGVKSRVFPGIMILL